MHIPQFAGSFDIHFTPTSKNVGNPEAKKALHTFYEISEDPHKEIMAPINLVSWEAKVNLQKKEVTLPNHIQINCSPEFDDSFKKTIKGIQTLQPKAFKGVSFTPDNVPQKLIPSNIRTSSSRIRQTPPTSGRD